MAAARKCVYALGLAACVVLTGARSVCATPLVGAEVGAGFFKFQGTERSTLLPLETLIGFVGGFQGIVPIGDSFGVQAGIEFANKGASWGDQIATDNNGNVIGTFKTQHSVQYVEVPVYARYAMATESLVSPHVTLGPTFSFEMSEQVKFSGAQDRSYDVSYLKSFDFGGAVGLGADVQAGPGLWTFDLRYAHGFTNLAENGFYGDTVHNNGFEIMTGYFYRTGRPH